MKIERPILISNLKSFACNGSGVIIGEPGVGKSFILAELCEKLKEDAIPHLILSVEQLGEGTDLELKVVLRKEGDFVGLLRSAVEGAQQKAILIFDGFDAARGESERAGILKLIRRAAIELSDSWNVIVSVRTFDAKKSERLLKLFPNGNDQVGKQNSSIHCRHLCIPRLERNELEQVFQQISGLSELYSRGKEEFQTLLTIPFNLWLIERVIKAGAQTTEFSRVTSEVQLLEMYWDYRIKRANDSADHEFLLAKIANLMVENYKLTVRRDQVYQPNLKATWETLFSSEMLREMFDHETRIAFAHNILFDYAISIYLLDPEPTKLAKFVSANPIRPIFLRPSLTYHFTRLWHFDRKSFWKNFWNAIHCKDVHFQQIVRIVLPAVVVNEAKTVEDLKPILDSLEKKEPLAPDAVAFVLQAIRVLQPKNYSLWINFIHLTKSYLDTRFAWDAGIIVLNFIEDKDSPKSELLTHCGDFGRELLEWAWTSRQDANRRHWFERLAGLIAIPLVLKTYGTGTQEARRLLEMVLNVIGEPGFPIDCIFRLTNEAKHLIPHDPELVSLIYERVFGYKEESEEKTTMGASLVLPLISNRRQDFHGCQYNLIEEFPRFLSTATLPAFSAGLRAIQAFVIQKHVLRYLKQGKTLKDVSFDFQFHNSTVSYIEDGSAIWDESSYPDQELQIADAIFKLLAESAQADKSEMIDHCLLLFTKNAKLAFLWSRLLVIGAKNPIFWAPRLWELATAIPILQTPDTLQSVGMFLEQAFRFLSNDQREKIELTILKLPQASSDDKHEIFERFRNRLIARIPADFLVTQEARKLRKKMEENSDLPPNNPLYSFKTTWKPHTKGSLDKCDNKSDSPINREIRKLYTPLKEWVEKDKNELQIDELLPVASNLLKQLSEPNKTADKLVINSAWMYLACFSSDAALRTTSVDNKRFPLLKQLILIMAEHPEPQLKPNENDTWDSAVWSPAPRIEAAQALPWLTHFGEDHELLDAIEKLAKDPVPAVRFLLASNLWRVVEHSPEVTWKILEYFTNKEANQVVLQGVTASIWNLISKEKNQSLSIIQKLLVRLEEDSEDEEKPWTQLVCMVVDFAILEDNTWAKNTIARWRNESSTPSTLAISARRLIAYLNPKHMGIHLERARSLLLLHLDYVAKKLTDLQNHGEIQRSEKKEAWKSLYGIIDEAVTRIYFASDIDPDLRQRKENPLDDTVREKFFRASLPVLEKVLEFGKQESTGMLLAPTAHHFMELLNGVVRYDPAIVLRLAADVVTCSKRFKYNLDSIAMRETVKLVESVIADYRGNIQDETSVKNLLELLEAFVEVGWPEALNLVWKLDEIYR